MLDAICTFDKDNPKIYSIFEFKVLPEAEIDKLRYSLLCPVCKQKAYFRKASKDGRQACFGSRYHKMDCSEFNPSARKTEEQKQIAEVEKILLEDDSLVIDFSAPAKGNKKAVADEQKSGLKEKRQARKSLPEKESVGGDNGPKVCKQGLAKLLSSFCTAVH